MKRSEYLHELKNIAQVEISIRHQKQRIFELENKLTDRINAFLDKMGKEITYDPEDSE